MHIQQRSQKESDPATSLAEPEDENDRGLCNRTVFSCGIKPQRMPSVKEKDTMFYPEEFPDIQRMPRPTPVLFIHSPERPFCSDFTCQCHAYQRQVAALLLHIREGEMTLREALDLMEEGIV